MLVLRIVILFLFICFCFMGCGRKPEPPSEEPETLSVELTLPQIPKPPYKPTNRDIQTALKNAGFYKGNIDGDMGLMSKRAIREFQAANNLVVDGKVGPKTWAVLNKYLMDSEETGISE